MKERRVTIATVMTERRSVQTAAENGGCWSFAADIPEAELVAAGELLAVGPITVDLSSVAKRVAPVAVAGVRSERGRSQSSLFLSSYIN